MKVNVPRHPLHLVAVGDLSSVPLNVPIPVHKPETSSSSKKYILLVTWM